VGQKISLQHLSMLSPNIDRFSIFLQGSIEIQLRCGEKFSYHVVKTFPQNVPVKTIDICSIFGEDINKKLYLRV